MNKKISVLLVTTLAISFIFFASFGSDVSAGDIKVYEPIYHMIDKDLAKDMVEAGVEVEEKEFKGTSGNSYLKPNLDEGRLDYLDVRGYGKKGIAILVDFPVTEGKFSDVPGVDYQAVGSRYFDDLLNGDKYNPYKLKQFSWIMREAEKAGYTVPLDRTMKNYYEEVSYGQFGIDVDVVGWYVMDKPYDYYMGQDKGYYNENGDAHIAELVKEALAKAAVDVDFSDYAVPAKPGDFWLNGNETSFTDSDGNVVTEIVPNVFIIHRGTGAEYSLDPEIIWSHKWDIASATYYGYWYQNNTFMNVADLEFVVHDGVALNTYNIVPEVGQDISGYLKWLYGPTWEGRDPSPAYPGVYSHEFGHVLGLPDLYDYGYDSEGVGMFTLMAGGSYGRNVNGHPIARWFSGNTPVHLDAWSKYYLGFAQPVELEYEVGKVHTLELRPSSEEPDIYKVNVPGSYGREFFLLENRQQTGFDEGLSYNVTGTDLHGLVVYHVVEDVLVRNFSRPNEAQNWDNNHRGLEGFTDPRTGENHYAVSVIQADGMYNLEKNVNDGDAGDVFPGAYGVTELLNNVSLQSNTASLYKWSTGTNDTGIVIQNIVELADGTVTCEVVFTK